MRERKALRVDGQQVVFWYGAGIQSEVQVLRACSKQGKLLAHAFDESKGYPGTQKTALLTKLDKNGSKHTCVACSRK